MAEETLEQFLDRRERELSARLSALRGQIAPVEAELTKIQNTRVMLGTAPNVLLSTNAPPNPRGIASAPMPLALMMGEQHAQSLLSKAVATGNPYAGKTIKELTIQALLDHFPTGGSAADIRDFIRDAYGRAIEPSSLRPQMHRLKGINILSHDPQGDIWDFAPGKRALYGTYDQMSGGKTFPVFQDDPDDGGEFLRRASELAWKEPDEQASNNEVVHDGGKLKLKP